MADVSDMNLVCRDGVEDKITQTRRNDHACVWFIRLSSFERIIRQAARTLDKTSSKARSDIRAVVADVSVNLREVAL
jgi:hypothetical protein